MKSRHAVSISMAALALTLAAACTKEERKTSAPPSSAPTPPVQSSGAPASAPSPASGPVASAPPEPPNPPSITGVAPQPPAPSGPGPAERAGRALGERIDDATLTAKVKTALLQSPDVKGTHVNVETEKGAVQLSGFVESQTQMDRALQIARAVNGVKEVHNKMSLKSGK